MIAWNSYDDAAKTAVLGRIEKLVVQILEHKLRIFSVPNLRLGLEQAKIPYDEQLSPYCWLHNLLKKNHRKMSDLSQYGVYALPEYAELGIAELSEKIEEELLALCQAHMDRYYSLPDVSGDGTA